MDIEKVGKAITYLRKRAGFTQKDLADRIGVSDKAVSKWERGLGLPDVSLLGKLSMLLDTDTDSLLAGDVIHHDPSWCGFINLQNGKDVDYSTVIHDKPLSDYLISYFLLVGIKNILVLCNRKEEKYLKKEYGDGGRLGIKLTYCVGTADDAIQSEYFSPFSNVMLLGGRSFVYGVDQTRFFQKAMADKGHATVLALTQLQNYSGLNLAYDENKKIVKEADYKTQYPTVASSVVFLPVTKLQYLNAATTNADFLKALAKSNELYLEILDRGYVDIEINSKADVREASEFVRIVQKHCGMNIYCPEEIAWRRGMIGPDAVRRVRKRSEEQIKYLERIVE